VRLNSLTGKLIILLSIAALLLIAYLGAACGREAQATPTPTKTPRAQEVAWATAQAPVDTIVATPSPTETLAPTSTASPTATPTPTETPSGRPANMNPLSGLLVEDPQVLTRRPLLVVVNNDPPARSVHYGLAEAEIVYEYIMEGRAVTRYTALFLGNESERIGPVRSARLINYYLAPQYGGALVASGAGQDVRWWLKNKMAAPYLDIDLDDPSNNVYSFSLGTDYRTRLQTSTDRLRRWLTDRGAEQDPELPGFAFSAETPAGGPGTVVSIAYPAQVTWSFDTSSGRYLRTIAGAAHIDATSGQQLSAANVIVQTLPHEATEYVEDSLGTTSIRIVTVGEGPVTILRDGVAIVGTWRAGDTTMPEFVDGAGLAIPLKPGNSWIQVVAPGAAVTVG